MNPTVKEVVKHFASRIYEIQFAPIPENAKKSAVDRDCRIVSDFIGTENEFVSHSTPHIIKHCKWWSVAASELYKSLEGSHSTRCEHYMDKKRAFAVEHEYPLGIIKDRVVKATFASSDVVEKFLWKYNKIVIVTAGENALLTERFKSAKTLKEAAARYDSCGIEVVRFDGNKFISDINANLSQFFI